MIGRRGLDGIVHPVAQNATGLQPDHRAMRAQQTAKLDQVVHIAANAADDEQGQSCKAGPGMDHGCGIPGAVFRRSGVAGICRRLGGGAQFARQGPDRGMGKQRRDRQIDAKAAPDLGEQLYRQQ